MHGSDLEPDSPNPHPAPIALSPGGVGEPAGDLTPFLEPGLVGSPVSHLLRGFGVLVLAAFRLQSRVAPGSGRRAVEMRSQGESCTNAFYRPQSLQGGCRGSPGGMRLRAERSDSNPPFDAHPHPEAPDPIPLSIPAWAPRGSPSGRPGLPLRRRETPAGTLHQRRSKGPRDECRRRRP